MNRMKIVAPTLIVSLLAGLVANSSGAQAIGRQEVELAEMLRIFPRSEPWEKWLNQSHALPPDFDAMPSVPFLPDPLRFANGTEVRKEDWPKRRQELLGLFERYVIGSFPPSPGNVRPARIASREEAGALIDEVELEFGPNHAAKLHLELILPKGQPPFPVFLTQETHRSWALIAVSRGYIGCVYAGADSIRRRSRSPDIRGTGRPR